jgi:hypothetical protein
MKPVKPKKPKKATADAPCDEPGQYYKECYNGKVKEWGDGPYPDYEMVKCPRCEGEAKLTPARQDCLNNLKYERELKSWEREMAIYNKMKCIKLTEEQVKLLKQHGFTYCKITKSKQGE